MPASQTEILLNIKNLARRSSYGVNGVKHYDLQKKRFADMASGGDGGTPTNVTMIDTSDHAMSIREMHYSKWEDSDFQMVLDAIEQFEKDGIIPDELEGFIEEHATDEDLQTSLDQAIEDALVYLLPLDHSGRVDALNTLAERLEVLDPDDEDNEDS